MKERKKGKRSIIERFVVVGGQFVVVEG